MESTELTVEQKIVRQMADMLLITDATLVSNALLDSKIADMIVYGNASDLCEHEALANEEIQEVFDNDEEQENN